MFKAKNSLFLHKNIHLDRKPFKCEVCGKEFNQKGNMQVHVKNYHSQMPEEDQRPEEEEEVQVDITEVLVDTMEEQESTMEVQGSTVEIGAVVSELL